MITSLRSRILLITTSTVVAALLTTGGATYAIVRANMLRSIDQYLRAIADGNTRAVDAWADSKARIVTAAADATAVGDPQGIIRHMIKSGGFPVALAGWTDKSFISTTGHTPAGYDPTSRPWYKAAIGAGHLVVTKPYGDVSTGVPYVAFSAPMNRDGVAAGVVSGAIALDDVRNIVKSVHPTPASVAFVVNRDGQVIAHPDAASMLKSATGLSPMLTPATLAALAQASEPIEVMISGTPKLLEAEAVQGTDWLLVVALDKGEAMAGLTSMLNASGIALLVLTAAAVGIAIALTGRSFRRLSQVRDAMNTIASGGGDLTRRLPATGRDEVAQIAASFNAFVATISAVLHEIRDSVESMKVATREIEAGNRDMSQRTEVSASNLQQTSASLTDLAGSIRRSADALVVANQLAASSNHAANTGVEVVASAVSTMDDIARSSMRISEIIGVIDGIAFQTNILALNASVEAARAGENGRGFAVVAGEVRMLAQRSAVAAREIKDLIEVAESGVKAGTQRVREAGANMSGIMEGIARVSGIIGDINVALAAQSDGITKIDRSITELDQATQQNSALVEENAAASSVLNDQALNLSRAVDGFKLAERQGSGL